jgi:hypothetical protein
MARQFICTACGFVGSPSRQWRGSFWIELLLWLLFIVAGLIATAVVQAASVAPHARIDRGQKATVKKTANLRFWAVIIR